MGLRKYKFWMVLDVETGIVDPHQHHCRAAAERLAIEGAANYPGRAFVVVEAMKMWETARPTLSEVTLDFAPMAAPPAQSEEPL